MLQITFFIIEGDRFRWIGGFKLKTSLAILRLVLFPAYSHLEVEPVFQIDSKETF